MKTQIISATILSVGIIVFAVIVSCTILNVKAQDQTVAVRGLSEHVVKANRVVWPVYFELGNNNLSLLYKQVKADNNTVRRFFLDNGIEESEISVNAPDITTNSNDYNGRAPEYRYSAKSYITITSDKIDLVRELMIKKAELIDQNIVLVSPDNWEARIIYDYTELNSIKPEMIQEANANARVAAEQFAKDSDCRIGKIKSARQGQFSIESLDSSTPYMKVIRVVTYVDFTIED